ncbi:galactokinase [Rubrivirga sp. IMCC43871]|uniref:galactokinase n=1 Tax=Rubrivirga sp. IMCC43871 TaxID=3391575 RepID=UPI00398FBACF
MPEGAAPMMADDRREAALAHFREVFGREADGAAFAPGRVNLIGEHIDYHGGPVLPAALGRGITAAWAPRADRQVQAVSVREAGVSFDLREIGHARPGGDWAAYLEAAATMVDDAVGVDLLVTSDLPEASGLSSSSALVVASGLAMLAASDRLGDLTEARRLDLATRFALAERHVGTAGGGMDQAASLGGKPGCALRIDFDPLRWRAIPVPASFRLVVAHTGVRAEKSGAAQARYNEIRAAHRRPEVAEHIRTEVARVEAFERALVAGDAAACGQLMDASHASLRDRLGVSHPALDALVAVARDFGAAGARMTGAGFGGSIVALSEAGGADDVVAALRLAQAEMPGAQPAFVARPGPGADVWRAS